MFNQRAKWLKVTRHIRWRRPIASLNYLLTSHVWRQDHNRFSHQDPAFIDHVVNKKAEIIRVYLPPDANLVGDVIDRVPGLGSNAAYFKQALRDKLIEHTQYIHAHGEDMPEIWNRKWGQ
jgi:phosphoketolase